MINIPLPMTTSTPGYFAESAKGEIRFPEISTPILEKVVQYLYYKVRNTLHTTLYCIVSVTHPHIPPLLPIPGAVHELVAEGAGLPPGARERAGAAHGGQLPRLLS